MGKPRVVITEFMDKAAVACLSEEFEVIYQDDLHGRRADLNALLRDADALIVRNRTHVDAGLLQGQQRLKAVGRLGVGLENIDQDVCRAAGIDVYPAIGANAAAVAEYVVCMAMMLLRGAAYGATETVSRGEWPRAALINGREAGGKRLGIVGLGSVGRVTADLARAVGMSVHAYDPSLPADHAGWRQTHRIADLDALMAACDVVSVHVPLLPATRGLIDARRLALMPRHAVLINVARGGVVDEAALAAALRAGHIGAAAVDVFDEEPLPADSALARVPNLVMTPHIAGVTAESNVRVSHAIADVIGARLRR